MARVGAVRARQARSRGRIRARRGGRALRRRHRHHIGAPGAQARRPHSDRRARTCACALADKGRRQLRVAVLRRRRYRGDEGSGYARGGARSRRRRIAWPCRRPAWPPSRRRRPGQGRTLRSGRTAGAYDHRARFRQRASRHRAHRHRRHDPAWPRPAAARHRRPQDRQDRDRGRRHPQSAQQRRDLDLCRDRTEGFDRRARDRDCAPARCAGALHLRGR